MTNTELESTIDAYGLSELLRRVAQICDEKAHHVKVNWQDEALAKHWACASARLLAVSETDLPS